MDNPVVINATIQEQVYQIIRREVVNRVYHEGEQLKEADLAQRFNVSRSPVREALHRLAGDGILTIVPTGAFSSRSSMRNTSSTCWICALCWSSGASANPLKSSPRQSGRS